MKYRNEWKYICKESQLRLIETKLNNFLLLDSHTKKGKYYVHSLYFDDLNNTCMNDNEGGENIRFKWRIRYYNDDLNYIVLEKKEKVYGRCKKRSCQINEDIFNKIMNNQISEAMWSLDNSLLKEFCVDILTRLFRPKVIIDYERTAYVEPITNVRVTFDRNISASNSVFNFLNKDYLRYPIQEVDDHILEVKFDDLLPSYIQQASYISSLQQTSFSKYYLSRKTLERE